MPQPRLHCALRWSGHLRGLRAVPMKQEPVAPPHAHTPATVAPPHPGPGHNESLTEVGPNPAAQLETRRSEPTTCSVTCHRKTLRARMPAGPKGCGRRQVPHRVSLWRNMVNPSVGAAGATGPATAARSHDPRATRIQTDDCSLRKAQHDQRGEAAPANRAVRIVP